jgi:hypothetical protein
MEIPMLTCAKIDEGKITDTVSAIRSSALGNGEETFMG